MKRHVRFASPLEKGPPSPPSPSANQLAAELKSAIRREAGVRRQPQPQISLVRKDALLAPAPPRQIIATEPTRRPQNQSAPGLCACLWSCLRRMSGMASLFDRITPRDTPAASASGSGTTSNIFGAAPATSQSQSSRGSLFPNVGNTSQPSNTGSSLFGATTQPPGTGLFASTTQPAGGSSLFGNTNSQPQTSSGGLFGAVTSTSRSANTGGSFLGTATSQRQSVPPASAFASNASLFGDNVLPSSRAEQAPTIDRPIYPTAPPANPAYFHALLDRGRKRQVDDSSSAFGALPQLQLGLQDVSRKVRNIGQGGPSASLARGANALAASGINANQALRDIDELEIDTAGRRPQRAVAEQGDYDRLSGVKETLALRHQNDFQKRVDRVVLQAKLDFDKMIDEKLHGVDWNAHRQRIYEHFGLKKPQAIAEDNSEDTTPRETGGFGRTSRRSRMGGTTSFGQSFALPGASRSVIGSTTENGGRVSTFSDVAEKLPADGLRPAPEDRVQRIKQDKYSDRVKDLNVARLQNKLYPLLHRFSDVEAEPSNDDTSMLVNAYQALIGITGEDASNENATDPGSVKERQFARDYLEDSQNAKGQTAIRKRIINGSRHFLAKLFLRQAEAAVSRNPREANVGGVPSSVALIRGYVRVRASRKELGPDVESLQEINGDYCWPVLFYLLRAGLYQEALEYVEENANAFRQIDRSFMRYLRTYVTSDEHRLPPDMQTHISNEYSQRQRLAPEDSIDPYRMACYKVIGRCDINRRSLDNITNDMLDWIWLQFALAREYSRIDEFAHEAFGLDELRQSIKEIGERYFGAGSEIANAPTTFFFMQILAGMFEKAVADLYPFNYVSATHFAIALGYYGLLRVSDISNSEDLLTYTTRQQAQIAFGSMVGLYTRDFRTANATAAVDYLTLICLNQDLTGALGRAQREMCHQALTEVVLETREFAQLLGDIRSDGQRIKGAVQQRLQLIGLENEQEFLKHITLVAARSAEEQSRATDAVLLFHLAEDYDKVLQVLNEAVSRSLTTEMGEQPKPITPLKPRNVEQNGRQAAERGIQSSLSLTAVDDPIELARNMTDLYASDAMFYSKIKQENIDCCRILLLLSQARQALEKRRWPLVVDHVADTRVLPTDAHGNITAIRHSARAFNDFPPVVARTIGYVMVWTVVACSNQVQKLRHQEYDTGVARDTIQRCIDTAKDVMVFAGLIRYKLPGRMWEVLAAAGQDLGVY